MSYGPHQGALGFCVISLFTFSTLADFLEGMYDLLCVLVRPVSIRFDSLFRLLFSNHYQGTEWTQEIKLAKGREYTPPFE